jgi:hypothetical protein
MKVVGLEEEVDTGQKRYLISKIHTPRRDVNVSAAYCINVL